MGNLWYSAAASFLPKDHPIAMHRLRKNLRFLAAVQLLPALESGEETLVGGQAVMEGVMMRSPHAWAIAFRKPRGRSSLRVSLWIARLRSTNGWPGPSSAA